MADFQFTVVDTKKWESLPAPIPPKPKDKYEAILDAIEAGEIIQVTVSPTEVKGVRISLGRKSRARGFVVEFRSDGTALYIKKSEQEIPLDKKTKKEKVAAEA